MSLAAATSEIPSRPVTALGAQSGTRVRDLRLDFFRGIAMFIILIAHTPGNLLTLWIPARWGFSDATEIFVFCSGMASAIAFGGAFVRMGWMLGTARVLFRVWQVYWAHVGLFFATLAMTVYLTELDFTGRNYWGQLNLWMMFVESDKWDNSNILLSFMTLRYVPNYFDILPMYMVVLIMMPLVMALARINLWAVAGFVALVWVMAQDALLEVFGLGHLHLEFPAEPWTDRSWFFNPFGWQLIFFTGFAFMRGWLPKPPVHNILIAVAAFVVLANVPLSSIGVREFGFDWAKDWRIANGGLINKSDFGILRYAHFLALAYLAWVAAGDKGARLLARGTGAAARFWSGALAVILKVGQQSLAVFVASMFMARVMGFALDVLGRSLAATLLVNLIGAAILIAVAYGAGWFKSQPWRAKAGA
ncbi:OpgC domain-containing protein [Sulfitobacter mediterraneus]|uniref:OpgC family protein n=1 Tax=Sulfitobacter mediterraneus TaxID=83219 RepID=UPI0019399DEA|nr:OpgC domain-containing protein [Sulfitobacter mediterraneus]MBM1556177.1 OpgC domain-containing protein [Sulfitobacter mediterraneus]MBM1567785.1 OpgC domain-containing protein [Sulfitobacter mediterraneus]MBM1571531.1 OpgC domain-containing protein [Sulfitobacter mediterraneus]MBM1575319.1 OpgC domain-containing protein [Sulfitobacter mediterraneus]MBM1579190.1 OpgC domain-containing protein [Sulfitobacter mediterraneus]